MTFLVDANLLIALTTDDHVHHDRATTWYLGAADVAVCPLVEGALTRFLLRTGEPVATAQAVVAALKAAPSWTWWPDDLSFTDLDLSWVTGYRQLTEAYLVGLARSRSATLATLDERLARAHPDGVELIP